MRRLWPGPRQRGLGVGLSRADSQIERYRQAILPQTSAAIDAARSAYLAGRGDFTTVILDFKEWLDARAQLAMRESERYIAWSELQVPRRSTNGERTMKKAHQTARLILAAALALS